MARPIDIARLTDFLDVVKHPFVRRVKLSRDEMGAILGRLKAAEDAIRMHWPTPSDTEPKSVQDWRAIADSEKAGR